MTPAPWLLAPCSDAARRAAAFVTACWYFSPGDDLARGASSEGIDEIERGPGEVRGEVPGSPTRRGLAISLSSSFGTLCYAALVLSVCELLNAIARKSMRSRNLFVVVAGCCLRYIVALIEFLNKFAVSHHAVTAAPFCTSARQITAILARNALSVYVVDQIGGFVLHFGAFVLSGLVAGLTTALVATTLPATASDRTVLLGVYMGLSLVVAFSTLNFLATLLLNVVDAAYTCHALDLEVGNLCTPACNLMYPTCSPTCPACDHTYPRAASCTSRGCTLRSSPSPGRPRPSCSSRAARRRSSPCLSSPPRLPHPWATPWACLSAHPRDLEAGPPSGS